MGLFLFQICVYQLSEWEVMAPCHLYGSLSSAVLDEAQTETEKEGEGEKDREVVGSNELAVHDETTSQLERLV